MEILITIPSKGRADRVLTKEIFPKDNILLFVPESELKEYQKHNKDVQIVGVPNEIKGITKTRNYILDFTKKNKVKYHIQVDDDAMFIEEIQNETKKKITDYKYIYNLCIKMFVLAEDIGFRLWGFRLTADMRDYRCMAPFTTVMPVVFNIAGIIDNDIWFDERFIVKEDYDYSMMHILKYGGVLRYNKYYIGVNHLFNKGGCASYRNDDIEKQMQNLLVKKWGKKYIKNSNNKNYITVRGLRPGI